MIAVVLALVVFAGIVLVFIGLSQTLNQESEMEQRLGAARGYALVAADVTVEGDAGGGGGGQSGGMASVVEQALSKRPGSDKTRELLGRADLKLTVGEYTMIRGATAIIGAGVGFLAGVTNSLIVGFPIPFVLAGAFLGWMAPRIYAGRRASGRLAAFNNQLADTIALLANALRSGNSVAQAMALASREAPPPTSQEFARVVQEMGLGLSPEDALQNLVKRVPSEDLDMMVTAMNVSAEVGGNLAEVLEKIGETIRQRVRLKGDIETLTAQQQGAGMIVSILPILISLVLFLLNGKYMKPMFSGFPYLCMPICAGLLIFIGFMAMKKITDIKV